MGGSLFSSFRVLGVLEVFGVLGVVVFKTPTDMHILRLKGKPYKQKHLLQQV